MTKQGTGNRALQRPLRGPSAPQGRPLRGARPGPRVRPRSAPSFSTHFLEEALHVNVSIHDINGQRRTRRFRLRLVCSAALSTHRHCPLNVPSNMVLGSRAAGQISRARQQTTLTWCSFRFDRLSLLIRQPVHLARDPWFEVLF